VRPGGTVVGCGQDAGLAGLLANVTDRRLVRYGIAARGEAPGPWDWTAGDLEEVPGGSRFLVHGPGPSDAWPASLQIPGRHHVLNALAAVAVCDLVGVAPAETIRSLANFHGTRRRFELIGAAAGVRVFTDYGHHPTEVRVNLEAARHLVTPPGRVWVLFQPHLRVRTEMLFEQFTHAFDAADVVVLTDVYSPSGREPSGNYRGSAELVAAMRHRSARHVPTQQDAGATLVREVRAGDVVLVMGAGPIYQVAPQLVSALEQRDGD
jgi:UDP-N-acetylmuramate--alanine ligase